MSGPMQQPLPIALVQASRRTGGDVAPGQQWVTKRLTVATALLFLFLPQVMLLSQPPPAGVDGVVFEDLDGDGTRDTGEPGITGVVVSNQVQVTSTSPDGAYRLPDAGEGVVFVSVPDGYRASGRFWRKPARGRTDFGLARTTAPASFTFVHASDTHVSEASLARLQRLGSLLTAHRPAFLLVSGDLIKDALRVGEAEAQRYYDLYARTTAGFPVAVWSVPGNHENFGIERHLSLVSPTHPLYGKGMYREHLGPTYYSFTHGGVHFVGLDSVDVDDLWYYGHVSATQLAWLRADLAAIPAGTPVVTFNHIPFVSAAGFADGYRDEGAAPTLLKVGARTQFRHVVSNLDEVLAVFKPYRWTLALGGHFHIRETIRFESGVHTRFNQTAAVVGPTEGTVPAISGVTLYGVRNGEIDDGTFIPLDDSPASR